MEIVLTPIGFRMSIQKEMFFSESEDSKDKINYIESIAKKNSSDFIPSKSRTPGLTDADIGLYQTYYNNMRTLGLSNLSLFPGYSFLALLQQNTMISKGCMSLASELTRKWGKVESGEKKDSVRIEEEFDKNNVKSIIYEAALKSFLFGGCLVYIDIRAKTVPWASPSDKELMAPLFSERTDTYEKLKLNN